MKYPNNLEQALEQKYKEIFNLLQINLEDPNFRDTPERITKALLYSIRGISDEVKNEVIHLFETKFPTIYQGIVVTRKIHVWSICPHHFKDVEYLIDFGIIYQKEALGLSRVYRIIKLLAAKPILQEDLTKSIVDEFNNFLSPKGIIIQLKGSHMCMKSRGIEQDCPVITSEVNGIFETDLGARQEFLNLLKNSN